MYKLSCVFFILFSASAIADDRSLIEQFFGKEGIEDKKSVYAGEMLTHYLDKPTFGEHLTEDVNHRYRLLEKRNNTAVYAVTLSLGADSQDLYIHLLKENKKWKISAIRKLALPGLFFMHLQELVKKTNRTLEEENQYQNMILVSKSDSFLKKYLKDNIVTFDNIAKTSTSDFESANKIANTLNLKSISVNEGSKVIDFNIGGMIDNFVGYMFIPEGKKPPRISDDNYIYVELVVGQWYLYKTT